MTNTLFRIVLLNIVNGILLLAIGFLILIGVKSGLGISIPVGAAAIAADREASTATQAIMLISTLMAALITGFISLPFIGLSAGLSGPLSCIAVAGLALIKLVSSTTPAHDDLPRLLKEACYIAAFPIAATGAFARQKLGDNIEGWVTATAAAILSYVAVLVTGFLSMIIFHNFIGPDGIVAMLGAMLFLAAYAGIMIGTLLSKDHQRRLAFRVFISLSIIAPLCACAYEAISGSLHVVDPIPLLGSIMAVIVASRMTRKYGWMA